MNKPEPTPNNIEAIRAAYLEEEGPKRKEAQEIMLTKVDEAIAFLQDNRDQIGGLVMVVMNIPGTALVDREEMTASSGLTFRSALSEREARLMDTHLRDLIHD